MQKHYLATLFAVALLLWSFGIQAAIVNVDAVTNDPDNPITLFLTAGTYDVTPIGIDDGGLYNAWSAERFRSRWVNAYSISSDEFAQIRVWDLVEYSTDLLALEHALSTTFTLASAGNAKFFNADSYHADNVGGMSLQVSSVPTPVTMKAEGIVKYIPAIIAASQGIKQGPEYDNDFDGYSENQGDCNDNNKSIYPGAIETCGDSIDQDCDGVDSVCQQSWIVGSWNLTHLEGVPPGVSYSSIWTFNSDGTYHLFFHAPPYYDFEGDGDYSLSGNTLTVLSGIATQIFGDLNQVSSVPLAVSNDNNKFSFVDDEWDRWTYSRM